MTGVALVLLTSGVPSFFYGVYRASRSDGSAAGFWGLFGLTGLAVAAAGVLHLAVPGFFRGVG